MLMIRRPTPKTVALVECRGESGLQDPGGRCSTVPPGAVRRRLVALGPDLGARANGNPLRRWEPAVPYGTSS